MKKIIILLLVVTLSAFIFAGCGGGSSNSSAPQPKPKTGSVTVIVKDSDGNALSGASVSMGTLSGMTNESGEYAFKGVKPGNYTLKASKDGYENSEKDIALKEGDNLSVTLVMKKKAAPEEMKDYSKVKSYKLVMEMTSGNNKSGKFILIRDDYGKKQHLIVYNPDGGKEAEIYVVGDKAKIFSGGKWMEVPSSQISMLSDQYLGFAGSLINELRKNYNESIKTPVGSVSYGIKRMGEESVNGYSCTKYRFKSKESTSSGSTSGTADIWIINSGPYKGYATRIVMTSATNGKTETWTINFTDFGKDMGIKLP